MLIDAVTAKKSSLNIICKKEETTIVVSFLVKLVFQIKEIGEFFFCHCFQCFRKIGREQIFGSHTDAADFLGQFLAGDIFFLILL